MSSCPNLLYENRKHGNPAFPCSVYTLDVPCETEEKIYCHWHNEVELLHITSGHALLQIDEKRYEIHEGDTAFIPPGHIHMVTGDCTPFRFTAIVFSPGFIRSHTSDAIEEKYITPLLTWQFSACPVLSSPSITSCISAMTKTIHDHKDGYEMQTRISLLSVFLEIYRTVKDSQTSGSSAENEKSELLKDMISYLQRHENTPVALEEMASDFHMSKGHLCRFFKQMTNLTVIEYLNFHRISRCIQKMHETDLSVSEIARDTGFTNISYFNRVFKAQTGTSPTQFRSRL